MRVLMVTNKWPSANNPSAVPFLVQQLADLERAGISISRFTFRGEKNPFNYGAAWYRLRQEHKLSNYDLIHAHFGQCGILGLPAHQPLLVTYHGSDLQGDVGQDGSYQFKGQLMVWLSQWVARHTTANILVAEHLRRFVPAHIPTYIIPCGIDPTQFHPIPQNIARQQLHLPLQTPIILFASDPNRPVKRYSLAWAAIQILHQKCPQAQLLTVGNAPYSEMPLYLNACDLVLLTSKHEGSPTIIKEALACNTPIVSTNVGDVHQQIAQATGCLICPDDPTSLAEGMLAILNQPRPTSNHLTLAHTHIRQITQQLIALYQKVLTTSQQ